MAKPKLALIPSTVGGSVYSVLPSNGDGDFDFSRASAATRINAQGLIETVAVGDNRLNYPLLDGTVQTCPHLLLEPQRTNLITYSETYGSGTFFSATSGSTIDNTTSISPSGEANATQVTSTGTGKIQSIALTTLSQNTDYAFSFYAKNVDATAVESRVLAIGGSGGSGLTQISYFNELSTENWARITHYFNTGTHTTFYVFMSNALNSGGAIQLWGAQLEAGSYSTSYIVSNSGSATTRLAEVCDGSGNASTFNDSEGVLMVQIEVNEDSINKRISLSNSSTSQRIVLWFNANNTTINVFINAGETINIPYVVGNLQEQNKYAFKYKENDCSLWINGIEVATDITATMPSGLSELAFDDGGGGLPFYGKTKQIQYFDSTLTDSELETLTSWMSFSDMAIDLNYTIQ